MLYQFLANKICELIPGAGRLRRRVQTSIRPSSTRQKSGHRDEVLRTSSEMGAHFGFWWVGRAGQCIGVCYGIWNNTPLTMKTVDFFFSRWILEKLCLKVYHRNYPRNLESKIWSDINYTCLQMRSRRIRMSGWTLPPPMMKCKSRPRLPRINKLLFLGLTFSHRVQSPPIGIVPTSIGFRIILIEKNTCLKSRINKRLPIRFHQFILI